MLEKILDDTLEDTYDDDALVRCPVCDNEYLHQIEVEVGWRQEDKDVQRHVSSFNSFSADIVPANNVASPNGYGYRRDYLVVRLVCESCGEKSEMEIRQHKGCTFISWIPVDESG